MGRQVSLSEWADRSRVSRMTAWRMATSGRMEGASPSPAGRWHGDVDEPQARKLTIASTRVSAHDRKADLGRQVARIAGGAASSGQRIGRFVREIGSGLSERRRELASLKENPEVGWFNDAKANALAARAELEFDPERQDRLLGELHASCVDNALWACIVHDPNPRALAPRLQGFVQAQSWLQDLTTVDTAGRGANIMAEDATREEVLVLARQAGLDLPEPYLEELVSAYGHLRVMLARLDRDRPRGEEPAHVFPARAFEGEG
jgi:hypothetical protein